MRCSSSRRPASRVINHETNAVAANVPTINNANNTESRALVVAARRLFRTDHVPRTADGLNQRVLRIAVDLCANAADVRLDDVRPRIEMKIPHVLEQHRARDDTA